MFSSWERTRRWVLSTEHGAKAATHHLWVFNAPILHRKIWWRLVELRRAGSVLAANGLGGSPAHEMTANPPVARTGKQGTRGAIHENGGGRSDASDSPRHGAILKRYNGRDQFR
jgi:hypothetical protein